MSLRETLARIQADSRTQASMAEQAQTLELMDRLIPEDRIRLTDTLWDGTLGDFWQRVIDARSTEPTEEQIAISAETLQFLIRRNTL